MLRGVSSHLLSLDQVELDYVGPLDVPERSDAGAVHVTRTYWPFWNPVPTFYENVLIYIYKYLNYETINA